MSSKENEVKEKVKKWGGVFCSERYVEDFEVTPEIAEYFLSTMGENRKVKSVRVTQYKNDILNNNFYDSPGLICFDWDGNLRDGQHRLKAIIEAKKPVRLSLKFGFSPNTIFDKNAVRTTKDTFEISKLTDAAMAKKDVVALVNSIIEVKYGAAFRMTATDNMKADFCNYYEDEILETLKISKSGKKGVCSIAAAEAAVFAAMLSGVTESKLTRFAECANTLYSNGDRESAAITFAKQMDSLSTRGAGDRAEIESIAEMAISDFSHGVPRHKRYSIYKNPFLKSIDSKFFEEVENIPLNMQEA